MCEHIWSISAMKSNFAIVLETVINIQYYEPWHNITRRLFPDKSRTLITAEIKQHLYLEIILLQALYLFRFIVEMEWKLFGLLDNLQIFLYTIDDVKDHAAINWQVYR